MRRNHQEDRLHCQIAAYLRLAEPPGFFWTSIENRGEGQREGARRKRRGCKPGVPDLLTIYQGRVLFLEVKTPKGRLHDSQRERIPEIEQAGAGVMVVRSVDDVFHALKEAGVPVKATPA